MKRAFLALSALLVSGQSFGMYYGPMLTFTRTPGFTLPEYRTGMVCQIFADKIVVNRRTNDMTSSETRTLSMDAGAVFKNIVAAQKGEIEESIGPTDGPSTFYTATLVDPLDRPITIQLETRGDRNVTNKAREAVALKNFINLHCH